MRLRTSPHRDGARAELMDVTLGFEDVAAGAGYLTREAYLAVAVGGEVSEDEAAEALEVERAGERASAAVAMTELAAIANTGQYAQALARLDAAQARAQAAAQRLEDEELAAQAKDMRELAQSWVGATGTVAIAVDTATDDEGRHKKHKKDAQIAPGHPGGGDERELPAMAPLSAPDPGAMRRTHAAAMEALRYLASLAATQRKWRCQCARPFPIRVERQTRKTTKQNSRIRWCLNKWPPCTQGGV